MSRMYICDDGHEEIVYLGRDCPLCSALSKILALEEEIEGLDGEINGLNDELASLEGENKDLESKIAGLE